MITEEPPYTPALSTVCRGLYCHCRENRTRAHEALERARTIHHRKRYELRIDDRTTIMVEKKNFNRAYAEAYRDKLMKN